MELKTKVNNGSAFKNLETKEIFVLQRDFENDSEDLNNIVNFLLDILNSIGYNGNKYDDKRIYITAAPGHKSELWSDIDCPLCGRKEFNEIQRREIYPSL